MNRRRASIGLSMLCVLLGVAFAAQSASAATKGTTGFTCVNTGAATGTFTKAHCKPSDAGTGNFSHVAIPQDTPTEAFANNETTEGAKSTLKLKMTVAGVATELQAKTVKSEGTSENKVDPVTGEHYITGHGSATFTEVTVTKPAGKGCKAYTDAGGVKGEVGVIHTNPLKGTTKGQGDGAKLEPEAGSVYASFIIDGCEGEALKNVNQTYSVEGSAKCPTEGATATCTHAEVTAQGTLKVNGTIPLGIEGTGTAKARANPEQATTYVSATTVETP